MIRRIELVNFMSHARTVIEPADGLTVLVGPNNCGKSAVVTALQILCHNDNSTYVTRHHERECTVTVETDDGHIVEWCRKNNSPRYTIDGQLFDRLNRGPLPDGLHQVLRLPKVAAEGDQEFDVHFGEQKSPVFLLDKSPAHAARFFASSSDAAGLVEMQKRHQQKMVEARRERIQLEAAAERLTADLVVLAVADEIGIGVGQVEAQHEELGWLASSSEELTHDVRTLEQAITLLNHRQSEATTLAALILPPTLAGPQPLADAIGALTHTQLGVDWQSARADSLSPLHACPDLADDRSLAGLVRELQSAQRASVRLDGECLTTRELASPPMMVEVEGLQVTAGGIGAISRELTASEHQLTVLGLLTTVPDLDDEIALTHYVLALTRAAAALQRTEAVHGHLDAVIAVPELAGIGEIEEVVRDLSGATTVLGLCARDLEQAEQAIREGERLLRTWAEQRQLCPTCGGPLDPGRLIAHTGACAGGHPHA